jgi:hypothetical protein
VSVALVTQHAKRMRRVILSSVTYVAVLYFFTLCYKWHGFRGGGFIEYIMRVLIFCTILFEKILVLRRIQRDTIVNVHRS